MDCLTSEQIVGYLRGGAVDARALEAHVRDCPACGMELLLARETLRELRAKPATRRLPMKRSVPWIPWAVAAAALIAVLALVIATQKAPLPQAPPMAKPPERLQPKPPPPPEPPKIVEEPKKTPVPLPPPELPPKSVEEPKKPEPPPVKTPEPEKPAPPPPAPKPVEEPKKPAPTLVERAVVARVTHSIGGPALAVGRVIRAGETLVTAGKESVALALEGYGNLYFRENSQAEIGASGDISLHEGEMLARLDHGKKLGAVKTPSATVDAQSSLFDVQATKTASEVTILDGRVMFASMPVKGPATVILKSGKAPEVRPVEAGFASWLPDKLASKKFSGWFEAETFEKFQGFKVLESEGASGRQAAVQIADQGVVAGKIPFAFKGKYAVWLRLRQYEAKPVLVGLHLNGQSAGEVKLEWNESKAWRWVGPLVVTADHVDLAVAALSRWPLKEGPDAKSWPVALDTVYVTTDLKFTPDKLPEERVQDLSLEEPK